MQQIIEALAPRPRTCVWELTRRCNLGCQHCGSSAGQPRPGELGTDECLRIVAELAALGTTRLTLSGGEPTLRADWAEIARAGVEAGIAVNLVTNGGGEPETLVRKALEAGLANVAVSLDGLPETHDELRARGSFARATSLVRSLAAAGLWVDVMFTANRHNLHELEALHALAGTLGAKGLRVQLGKPMGRQTGRTDLTLRPRDVLALLPRLGSLARGRGPIVRVGDSVGYYSDHERVLRGPRRPWSGCYAGVQAIGIQADGSVKGCLSLQPRDGEEDPFIEGNLRDCSLEELWFRPGAFAYNRSFDPRSLRGACARCSHAAICRGGAKCVAHATTGSFGSNPLCYLAASRTLGGQASAGRTTAPTVTASAVLLALGLAGCSTEVETTGPTAVGGAGGAGAGTTTSATTSPAGGAGGAAASGGGGASVDAGTDAGPDGSVDCSTVCCDCEYGVPPPPEAYQACCCEGVCCECDYGVPPPPACCP